MTDKNKLTLEEAITHVECGVICNPNAFDNEQERIRICQSVEIVLDAARAHLSQPVVGDEQVDFAAAKETALDMLGLLREGCILHWNDVKSPNLARAFLALSEQLAAEREKVKALQPKADAYEAGVTQAAWAEGLGKNTDGDLRPCTDGGDALPGYVTVRVCMVVEGDSND